MGEVAVPREALWRAQTQRAVQNFPISGVGLEDEHVAHALRACRRRGHRDDPGACYIENFSIDGAAMVNRNAQFTQNTTREPSGLTSG